MGTPAPCRIYLGKVTSAEKPAPYWQVTQTPNRNEANMEEIKVEVTVSVSADLRGRFETEGAGAMLRSYVEPETHVKVILPVLVNNKHIEATGRLFIYEEAKKVEEKKREAPQVIDGLAEWKRLKAAQESAETQRPDTRSGTCRVLHLTRAGVP